MEKAIIVEDITKKYKLYTTSKERMLDVLTPKSYGEDFFALTKVNFEADKGEVIGFIGVNGSGKSTLSNIIAGIVPATAGTVRTNGQVAIIAVAAGLKNDLTGRDNIELKLLMLGFNKHEIKEMEEGIIEFSELGKFIDQPVKSYSSGMKSRLGFAISVSVDPDILIIDEALSVGDRAFAEKSLQKMKEFKAAGKTMVFVSHSLGQMRQFCDKILWLEFGMVKDYGPVDEILPKYDHFLSRWQRMDDDVRDEYRLKASENQAALLKGEVVEPLNIDDFFPEEVVKVYEERPISVLGHIQAGESYIYPSSPRELDEAKSTHEYKNKVYYIKKQANYNGKKFYLLSVEPSAVDGVIGWVSKERLSLHRHVIVDYDQKFFKIKGIGKSFSLPWGGKRDCIIDDLALYKGENFLVSETNLVGNNVWYKGVLQNKEMWIHANHLLPM